MCLRDFHLAGSGEGVHGLWRHVYTTGLLVQVGWVEGRVVTTDIVLVDLVEFLAFGPSIEKMLLNTVSLKTRMCRDKQSSR